MNDLTVITRKHSNRTVITVAGEMDLATCPALAQATLDIPPHGEKLHLEMSGVFSGTPGGLNLLLHKRY
ncbi:hypothetical protein [Streptomyces sp. NPDC056628]|uniref:hypothetical protein n=1 Tax=Streptomyces sp. NPDC056628 TaxID=3345882 RepID=UPI00369F4D89